ncbi:MAG TPA: lipid-binding SYLF domain-containing protein [Candidatus Limnocylindrales bacterium]|jgi:lipid-binding SYLF domain-containing protein|nr:lipid-binding SYLF domain-containing protein [Candidatus Limnocylindrales bacterium]
MKPLIAILTILSLGCPAMALDRLSLEQKVQKLTLKFDALQAKPDKRVPADVLAKAKAIILLDRTKAGFIFAYQGGGGLAMVKDKKGKWSPLAFVKADEASLGFQIGGEQTFFVILLMNDESAKTLNSDSTIEIGGEARGTAGDTSAGVEGKVEDVQRAVIIYNDRQGLFGGAAVKGGVISPDIDANLVYYDAAATMNDILFEKKFKATDSAVTLARKIAQYTADTKP